MRFRFLAIALGFFLLMPLTFLANSRSYILYHQTKCRITQDILDSNFNAALLRFDSMHHDYSFIFSNECLMALQTALVANDSTRSITWLTKCFTQGVPEWILQTNGITRIVFESTFYNSVLQSKDSLRTIYANKLNYGVRRKMEKMFRRDQWITHHLNDAHVVSLPFYYILWLRNNRIEKHQIMKICKRNSFPGEQLIGIMRYYEDSTISASQIRSIGPGITNNMAMIMLLHFYTTQRKSENKVLFKALENGYLTPYQYGSIQDFMSKWKHNPYGRFYYYNVWHNDPDSTSNSAIDQRRLAIGLPSLALKEKLDQLNRANRKNRKLNNVILLN